MPLSPDHLYIKSVDEGRYTIVFNGTDNMDRDYVDVVAVIMHSNGRPIHVFDPDWRPGNPLAFFASSNEAGDYLKWLKRRANS